MSTRLRALLTFLALACQAGALEIRETRWGFDGRGVPGRFTILSVLVAEPGPKAFDGTLSLLETRGMGSSVGAPLVQAIYLTPGTQRWVQFTPFVVNEYSWELRWGSGEKARRSIDGPKKGGLAAVLLLDPSSISAGEVRLRGFPDDLFPTTVAATDTLDQIVLDHVPRWDAPRRETFLDWLRRGGIVHILRGPAGPPIFEGDLAVLNTSLQQTRAGAGYIVRHELTRGECTEGTLKAAGFPPRDLKNPDQQTEPVMFYGFDQMLLRGLASLTKPEVAWWLLYLLTIAYLVIIGPVHYRWSRRVDYRIAIGGFLGTVAAFALAFIVAGARGSGEKQTAHTVSVATALGGQRWDVMQWSCAFATSGDYYTITHQAPANLYSATSDTEGVNGKVFNGKDGHFDVDIPLYSTRPFLHRAVMSGPTSDLRASEWSAKKTVIELPEGFHLDISEAWLRRDGRYHQLTRNGQQLTTGSKSEGDEYFKSEVLQGGMRYNDWDSGKWDASKMFRPLAARYLGDVRGMENPLLSRPLSPTHAQAFIWATAPASFGLKAKGFSGEKGWALFVVDVFAPEVPAPVEKQ